MGPIIILLLLFGLVGPASAHGRRDSSLRRRKSLALGPVHLHNRFHSSLEVQISESAILDPFDVAKQFVENLLRGQLSESSSFQIRKDSYIDSVTGVSHIYVRQIVNGLEVVDGDMNLNVKDGVVLSYGNSFYVGLPPVPHTSADGGTTVHPHREYCTGLASEHDRIMQAEQDFTSENQMPLNERGISFLHFFDSVYLSTCRLVELPYDMANRSEGIEDVRAALLQFMAIATPSLHTEADILRNHDTHKMQMTISPASEAGSYLIGNVPDTVNPVKATLAYSQVSNLDGDATSLELVWKFEIEMEDNWYETAVAAGAPHRIISVVDWTSDSPPFAAPTNPEPYSSSAAATYNVFAWGINDPSLGNRSLQKEKFDALASPVGWHSLPFSSDPSFEGIALTSQEFYRNTTTTWGNNVFAHENWGGGFDYVNNYRPDGGQGRVFDYVYAPIATDITDARDEARKYINTTVTQLFYISNMVHDLYYRYGFDEVSGNFQQYNFDRGGEDGDAVIANAQDGSGYNDAKFTAPPDGTNGRCRMYLWNTANPYRDGDLDAGILIHELTHGLTMRLTGGPAKSSCLPSGESGGMGEGWSDFFAITIRSTENVTDCAMGAWTANYPAGARNYLYSLNETTNPTTYETLDRPEYATIHSIGSVWAEMLWVVSHKLIARHGYAASLFPPAPLANGTVPDGDFYHPAAPGAQTPRVPKHGNTLALQLVLSGLKLQPCRPSFFSARDAIIQADVVLTGGANACTLWEGFAARGLGPAATWAAKVPRGRLVRTNDFNLPAECKTDDTGRGLGA